MSDDLKSWHAESWHAGYHCRDHQVADLERMLRAAQSALTEQHAANARLQAERDALAEQLNSVTSMAERFGQERDALRKDAERWRALCNLWLMCTILTLTQDEDGRWSIEATEPVDNETFATLTGDDPDSAIDAALAGRE